MNALKILSLTLVLFLGSAYTNETDQYDDLREKDNEAFTYGEELKFRVHYGWINAASVKVKVADKPVMIKGRPTYNVSAYGKTFRSFDWAFRVRDHFVSYIDSQSIAPLKYYKKVEEDNYRDDDLVYYDHEKKKLKGKKKDMDMPAYLQDIVSSIFYARTIDFSKAKIGQSFPIDIYLDQEIYNLKFKYIGQEVIKSDLGKVNCYKLRPQLVVDRVFKDEDDMTIWISADANKIPIRVKANIYIGSVKIDITSANGLRNPFSSKK
ncbi:MAG: hypothetical protein COA58_12910 [Bacteroidetes bacterium]|nr:MAG: hypothetical protein COA58_12910 [Bacteroidota bacterium]